MILIVFPLLEYLDQQDIPAAVATSTARDQALRLLDKAGTLWMAHSGVMKS